VTITERSIGDVTVLDVQGRITVQDGATAFRDALWRLFDLGRHRIIVNMAAVPYIDSTALGELVRGYTSAVRRGGGLKLLHPGAPVRQLLAVTRLASGFDMVESEAEAIERFGESTPLVPSKQP
jgi:anti-anti-sigma factor